MPKKKNQVPINDWYEVKGAADGGNPSIYVFGPIVSYKWDEDDVTAKGFIDDLNAIESDDIDIYVNSPGGAVFAGMAIYNAISRHSANVHVNIEGLAASIASVIALAGDSVSIADNALFMIHDPWSFASGSAKEMRKAADILDKVKDTILNVYEARSDLSRNVLDKMMSEETWMTGNEAVEAGFADEVYDGVKVAASIPDGVFKNAPDLLTGNVPISLIALEDFPMPEPKVKSPANKVKPVTPAVEGAVDTDAVVAAATAKALADEKQRKDAISAVFSKYPDEHELRATCIEDMECDPAKASTMLLDKLAAGSEPLGADIQVVDAKDRFMEGAVEGSLIRAGLIKDDGKNEFRSFGFHDMARAVLEMNGVSTARMSIDQIIKAAITHSTGDFGNVYENVMHKTLLGAFRNAPDTWSKFCSVGDLSDFRAHNRYRSGSFADLQGLNENGELKHVTTGDAEKETITANENGVIFNLSYKMIKNDDMGYFTSVARNLGRAAKRSVENDVYALILANAAMGDGTALFHADHGNLAASGGAISIATISAGRSAMARQQDPDGNEFLDLRPAILLCPTELSDNARVIVGSETDSTKSNSKALNPIRNIVGVVDTPRLTGNGWYMLGNPADVPTIEVGFLNGQSEPVVEMEDSFDTRGVAYRVTYDYGVAAVEYRAGYKNAGV